MWSLPILDVLGQRRCRFVLVGSAARALTGEPVTPNDVDIVVDASPHQRACLVEAMVDLRASLRGPSGSLPITRRTVLPWDWGWRATTGFGDLDVVTRFIDDTTFADHRRSATSITLPNGTIVLCHPTRWAA
jgi:hypothetical protein